MRHLILSLLIVFGIGVGNYTYAQEDAAPQTVVVEQEKSIIGELADVVDVLVNRTGPLGGIIIGSLITIFAQWYMEKRKVIKERVDSLQDLVEKRFTEKFGKEAGKEARELMEGVEDRLSKVVDQVLDTTAKDKVHPQVSSVCDEMEKALVNRRKTRPTPTRR